jgi:hypothetical protein
LLAVYFDKTGTHAQSYSEAGSPACASVRGWRGSRPDASGMACPFCDRRPALSRRLLRRRARDLHVRRRHVCSRDLHSLECGAAGSRAAVRIPRRRVPGRPRHLRGRRGRALDDADEDLLKSALLAFENWVSRRNGVGARVSAPSTGFTRSRRQRGLPHRVAGEAEGMPTTTLLRSAARRQLYSASQPCLDCGNQDEQDGEGETEAYGGGLGNLVRLEFRILCRDHHVVGVHPSRGRVEYF